MSTSGRDEIMHINSKSFLPHTFLVIGAIFGLSGAGCDANTSLREGDAPIQDTADAEPGPDGSASDPGVSSEPGDSGGAGVCVPGTEIELDACNACLCDENHQWLCTAIGCMDTAGPDVCEEGATELAADGCNTCTCANGVWECTEKGCEDGSGHDPEPTAGDPGQEPPVEEPGGDPGADPGQGEPGTPGDLPPTCAQGDDPIALDACNVCFCTDDGSWACTDVICDDPAPTGCEAPSPLPSPDACGNTCVCEDGEWLCTLLPCKDDEPKGL
jgi:hypothetical protein